MNSQLVSQLSKYNALWQAQGKKSVRKKTHLLKYTWSKTHKSRDSDDCHASVAQGNAMMPLCQRVNNHLSLSVQ